jgi:hypothetical protein
MAISLSFGFNLAPYVEVILALSVGIIFALNVELVSLSVGTFLVSGQEWSMMNNVLLSCITYVCVQTQGEGSLTPRGGAGIGSTHMEQSSYSMGQEWMGFLTCVS